MCALAAPAQSEATFPATLEVDLIFPRNNEGYSRIYPFPFVFAIQGAAAAWPHEFSFTWEAFDGDRSHHDLGAQPDFSGAGNKSSSMAIKQYTSGNLPEGNDPLYVIAGTDLIVNSPSSYFSMTWSADFHQNCSTNGTKSDPASFTRPRITGLVRFTISDLDPELHIAPPDGSCPRPNDTKVDTPNTLGLAGFADDEPTCIILDEDNLRPKPDPCAVKGSPELASRVTQSMIATSRCTGVSWPDEKLTGRCDSNGNPPKSVSSRPCPSVAAVGLCVFVSFAAGFAGLAVSTVAF